MRRSTDNQYSTWTELTCHNKCQLPDHLSYIWYKNEQKLEGNKVYFYPDPINPGDTFSCAADGHEDFPSPPVCEFTYSLLLTEHHLMEPLTCLLNDNCILKKYLYRASQKFALVYLVDSFLSKFIIKNK